MRFKLLLCTAALSALALPLQAAPTEAGADKPFVIVNGTVIPASHADIIRRDRAARGGDADNISDDAVRDALVSIETLSQAAERKGLDKRPDVQALLALQRKEVLVKLLQEDFVKNHPIADERLRTEYDKAKAKAGDTEYLASHILVDDEKKAKEVIAQLKTRKYKFADVAKKYSKDSSAAEGGSLGWMVPGSLVPEFGQAMAALKKGTYTTTPVKSRFGWHIIKLEDVRKLDFPAYDKVKDNIAKQLLQMDFRAHVAELRSAAKVEIPTP